MSVCRVYRNHIDSRIYQSFYPPQSILADTYGGAASQPSLTVFASIWVVADIIYIFAGNESHKSVLIVYYRQLFDTIFPQNHLCLFERSTYLGCNEIIFGHHCLYLCAVDGQILDVAACNHTHEMPVAVYDGQTAYVITSANFFDIDQSIFL